MLVLKCQGSRSPGLLRFSRSALGSGVPVQLSPYRGCLSGSSERGGRGGGLGELLRTSGGRVFLSDCTLKSWPWRFWVIHVWVFSGSPSGSECSVLCFRHGDGVLRDLPCSSVGGLHCPGPVNARQIAWETVITCGCGQVFLVRLGRRIVGGACRSQSPSGSGCLGTGGLALGRETVGFVSLGPVALVLSLRVFFVKNLLSSWYLGVGVALALTLARLLLRDFGPLVPRSLIPVLWWLCWSWVARSCLPGQITASVLVPGSWTWLPRLSPAVCLPPMGWLGWWACVCLHFLKCVCIISWKYRISFLGNLSFRLR